MTNNQSLGSFGRDELPGHLRTFALDDLAGGDLVADFEIRVDLLDSLIALQNKRSYGRAVYDPAKGNATQRYSRGDLGLVTIMSEFGPQLRIDNRGRLLRMHLTRSPDQIPEVIANPDLTAGFEIEYLNGSRQEFPFNVRLNGISVPYGESMETGIRSPIFTVRLSERNDLF